MADFSSKLRLTLGIFGRRNAGKSSIFNRLARHRAAVVSPTAGTTTDPVKKAMEHHFLGPLMLIDTGGLDDVGELGQLRVEKARKIVETCHVALIVTRAGGLGSFEEELAGYFREKKIPFVMVFNGADEKRPDEEEIRRGEKLGGAVVVASALTGEGMDELYTAVSGIAPNYWMESRPLVRDLFNADENALLIVEADEKRAPGRILPVHNRIIRDALDNEAICTVVPSAVLKDFLSELSEPPALIAADTKVFGPAAELLLGIPITTTSIILDRISGELINYSKNAMAFSRLAEGSSILMVNLYVSLFKDDPAPLRELAEKAENFLKKKLNFTFAGRREIPDETDGFDFLILLGQEALTSTKTIRKIEEIKARGIPATSYDYMEALWDPIRQRAIEPFLNKYEELKEIFDGKPLPQ